MLRKAPKDTGKGFYTVIRVEEVRELIERLHRTRGRAGHRVVIVDPIDDCNVSSANALLKIVEEPPPDTLFLLVSHRPGQLLPTIKSRCHPIALRPLSDAGVRAVVAANRPDVEGEAVERAVALAPGRPRRAFEALLLSDAGVLTALKAWLADPVSARPAVHLGLADALGTKRDSAEARFGRDIVLAWLAGEAREAAVAGPAARSRLASANELWDKAVALFEDTDEYYLDARQTLVAIFDAIRKHLQHHSPVSEPT